MATVISHKEEGDKGVLCAPEEKVLYLTFL